MSVTDDSTAERVLLRHAVAQGYVAEGELDAVDGSVLDALRARVSAEEWEALQRFRSELEVRKAATQEVTVREIKRPDRPTVRRELPRSDSPTITAVDPPAADEPEAEAEQRELPASVGPYRILGELGRGGMGVVFRGRHDELDRDVAIKVLRSGSTAGKQQRERFRLEARAAARLRHPNLVVIHDVGEADGTPYLVMDLIEGEPLDERLEREGSLDPHEAAQLCAKIARALHYVHANMLVHRDTKPANVLQTAAGEPLLTDFGLAKHLDAEAGSGLTNSGQLVGTPSYMAPEQAHGGLLDARTDVYGLGATLYALLTGQPPFDGTSVLEIVGKLVKSDPERPSSVRGSKIPKDLETICLTCLEKEPARRYPTAEALAQDLERFGTGDSIAARPPGVLRREWDAIRKNRPTSWVTNLAVVVFALVLCYALVVIESRRDMMLQRAHLDARSVSTRLAAAKSLRRHRNTQSAAWLMETARLDEHPQVRAMAQESLLEVIQRGGLKGGFTWMPSLFEAIGKSTHTDERARLWSILRAMTAARTPPPPAADDVEAWRRWWDAERKTRASARR